ncbi:MAG: glycoside hydrolase family 18 protein [Clostridia bacterium]|nr:glycoside hydrolase family 18 protein [Clostridia bacterium]
MKKLPCLFLTAALVCTFFLSAAFAELPKEEPGVTVYFPNWNIYSDSRCDVNSLPWNRLDCVNHAFWEVVPRDGGFSVVSTDPWADTDPDNPAAHFPRYAECAEKHPDTKILISIGGWTDSGHFSEMALTAETRGSFIQSCLEVLDAWPFLSGLDIDWEYPGVARDPEDEDDEGNPVAGDDWTNYTLLLKELREALDAHFGAGAKILTVCAGASVGYSLCMQDYASLHPYVDRINLMTYDMAGPWEEATGHHTALLGENSAEAAVNYLLDQGVPAEKIAIGSPLYSHGWKMKELTQETVGAAAEPIGDLTWHELLPLEQAAVPEGTPGWHMGYDERKKTGWLWNDDPASPDYLTFYTYDSAASLQAKLDYIREHGLGGLIVWEVHGDSIDDNWPMITRMHDGLHP